jgi:hypothetical protein
MRASPLAASAPPSAETNGAQPMLPPLDSPDWLTLQQASCELGASVSTIRRMVRDGRLLNRMVPHRGGFAYLVFIPQSRHGALRQQEPKRRKLWLIKGQRETAAPLPQPEPRAPTSPDLEAQATIASLERQVDQLSHALARALRTKQRALPAGIGDPGVNDRSPYARYRWLRRRRWWPF